jgi:hypothetical protein
MSDQFKEQVKRLNPFDITLEQGRRFYQMIDTDEGADLWDEVAKLTDEQIDFVINGSKDLPNMPYRFENGAIECDNGYIKLEWLGHPSKEMKNEMDEILRTLKRAVAESTIDGKPWQEWGTA